MLSGIRRVSAYFTATIGSIASSIDDKINILAAISSISSTGSAGILEVPLNRPPYIRKRKKPVVALNGSPKERLVAIVKTVDEVISRSSSLFLPHSHAFLRFCYQQHPSPHLIAYQRLIYIVSIWSLLCCFK